MESSYAYSLKSGRDQEFFFSNFVKEVDTLLLFTIGMGQIWLEVRHQIQFF